MTIIGGFAGGGLELVPAGKSRLMLACMTVDRMNMDTASWTITSQDGTKTYTAEAGEDGRAIIDVDSGPTYTMTLNHNGQYYNDGPQMIVTESTRCYVAQWELFDYPNISNVIQVRSTPNTNVTATNGNQIMTQVTGADGLATFHGLTVENWTFTSANFEKVVFVDELYMLVPLVYIYGVRITRALSGPSDRCEYTDDCVGFSPARGHDLNSWKGNELLDDFRPVRINASGKVYLDKRNLTLLEDGTNAAITTNGNDAFTQVPLRYLDIHDDGETITIRFSNAKADDLFFCYAHTFNATVQPEIYIGCFLGYVTGNRLYSRSGVTPSASISITNFISYAQARGAGYDIMKWFQLIFIQALHTLIYCSTNSQVDGPGMGYVGATAAGSPITTFDNDYGIAGSESNTVHMAFLWIVDLWGNLYCFIGGMKTDASRQVMVIMDGPSSVNDADFQGTGIIGPSASGYMTDVQGTILGGFLIKAAGGSATTFWCDYGDCSVSNFPYSGGSWRYGANAGLFSLYVNFSAAAAGTGIGSRLSLSIAVGEATS